MTTQNKTRLQFMLGGILMLTFAVAGCNNNGEKKETTKDSVTFTPPVIVKDSNDTMEPVKGNKAPGNDVKP